MTDQIAPTQAEKSFIPCSFCGKNNEAEPGRVLEHEGGSAICAECVAGAVLSLADYAQGVRAAAAERTASAEPVAITVKDLKPWADYHGDLPDYDHPLRPVFESGIQYAVALLAKTLGVEDWSSCDGTEEFDGDLGGTLFNIVLEAMPKDADGDPIHPSELVAPPSADVGELVEALRKAHDKLHECTAVLSANDCADVAACMAEVRALLAKHGGAA